MTPVFLFSLPRAGSTLLQRLMMSHPEIASAAEPWFLLPLLSSWEEMDCFTSYNHRLARSAMLDMSTRLPGGAEGLRAHQRAYCEAVYKDLSGTKNCRYFLDKTPRYHVIAKEIVHTFPNARFIFLWRNPLAVVASMCETWYQSHWKVYRHQFDLHHGIVNLLNTSEYISDRAHCIKYEDLVSKNEETLAHLANYLDLSSFSGELTKKPLGIYGDSTGSSRYMDVTDMTNDKWKRVFNTPLRKRWGRNYLNWIGDDRLAYMGFSGDNLRQELSQAPSTWKGVPDDMFHQCRGAFFSIFEPVLWVNKWRNFRNGYPAYQHK